MVRVCCDGIVLAIRVHDGYEAAGPLDGLVGRPLPCHVDVPELLLSAIRSVICRGQVVTVAGTFIYNGTSGRRVARIYPSIRRRDQAVILIHRLRRLEWP